jgi:glycosyltransferase involved in cell wall biosynthesis
MKISFVIPAYNEENYLGNCLNSIFKQTNGENYDFEIIVVNNASSDKTREVALKCPGVKIVDEPIKGLSRARHSGFLAASGDLIANIDADTILTRDWIDTVLNYFSKNKNLIALSGPHIHYDLAKMVKFYTKIYYLFGFLFYFITKKILNVSSMIQGGNFVVRKTALEKIGGFDQSFTFYGEDASMAKRLHKIGNVIFTFKLPLYASGRRLKYEGEIVMGLKYPINYFWTILFNKPFSKSYIDIREKK